MLVSRRRTTRAFVPEHERLLLSIDESDPDRGVVYYRGLDEFAEQGVEWAKRILQAGNRWAWLQIFAKHRRMLDYYVRPNSTRHETLPTRAGIRRNGTHAQLSLLDWTRKELAEGRTTDFRQGEHLALNGKLKDYMLGFLAGYPECETAGEALNAAGIDEATFWHEAEEAL